MHERTKEAWVQLVANAQKSLEGASPFAEDALIIRADVYMTSMEKRIAEYAYREDILLSRTMSVEAAEKLAIEQIANEELTKGNV